MLEKRKSPRFAIEAEILWRPETSVDSAGPAYLSHIRDLSTGGLSVTLNEAVMPGDTLQLELKLPAGQCIYSRAKVAWVTSRERLKGWDISVCEGGLEFLNLSESDVYAIDHYISDTYDL